MLRSVAIDSFSRLRRLLFPVFVVTLLFNSTLAHAQIVVKVNDTVNFRFGTLIQSWLDELQDASTQKYAQNLYLRRIRFLIAGQVAPNVSFYFQTDNPNLGKTPKALGSGFLIQDAWVEWKLRDEFMIEGGEFIVPMNRIELVSSAACLTVDISPTANLFSAPTQSNGNRDTGFGAKGYLADGRLEYRAAVFQGIRDAATSTTVASRNAFRRSGYLQYDFWEKERGYTYPGTSLGKRKILVVAGGYDGQKDYKSYSGNFSALPEKYTNPPREVHEPSPRSTRTLPEKYTQLPREGRELILEKGARHPRESRGPNREGWDLSEEDGAEASEDCASLPVLLISSFCVRRKDRYCPGRLRGRETGDTRVPRARATPSAGLDCGARLRANPGECWCPSALG